MTTLDLTDWEREEYDRYADDVDADYIQDVASAIASSLASSRPAGVCFQPGDGTAYRLVFTPLWTMGEAPARIVRGQRWAGVAVEGLGEYRFGDVLISWVDHAAYPLRLVRGGDIASSYVGEKWGVIGASSITLALLFRAVASRLSAGE